MKLSDLQYFDRKQDVAILWRQLPHWPQAGTLCFMTWRTADSVPVELVKRWERERATWLSAHDIEKSHDDWRSRLAELPLETQDEYHRRFTEQWDEWLDRGYGAAVLRRRELATIVGDSLAFFDGDRYVLTDYIVMPTHVHLLAAFPHEEAMLRQIESWKHFTATQINRRIGSKGRFWQEDEFDHLVRSEMHFEHYRRYIAQNGPQAKLSDDEYLHYSKPLMQSAS